MSFSDVLIDRIRELGHPLCAGLDPYLESIPVPFRRGDMDPHNPKTAIAVEEFCCRTIDLLSARVAAIKPQSSLFERLGWQGCRVLGNVVAYARAAGLTVVLDVKRGDIADTALGYAQAYLEPDASCSADAITVNPYLGPSTLEPFIDVAERNGRGVFVLVRNSNPDSSAYQAVETSGGPFYTVVANSLVEWERRLRGENGWSSLGITAAATHPDDSERIRSILPRALFLVLGYGTQGASAADAVRGFVQGPKGREGGLVSSSRRIVFPTSIDVTAATWEQSVQEALARLTSELGEAVSR